MKKQIEFTVKNYLDVHLELFKKINFIEIDNALEAMKKTKKTVKN